MLNEELLKPLVGNIRWQVLDLRSSRTTLARILKAKLNFQLISGNQVKLWVDYVKCFTPEPSKSGKLYVNIKTHQISNPTIVITSGCSAAVESLLIFVEKELEKVAESLPSRIKVELTC